MADPVVRFRPALLDALRGYGWPTFARDAAAGAVVAVVALPLAIAFAVAAGADPRAGLVTAVVGGAVAASLGGARIAVSGPTSSFAVVLATIAAQHGLDGLLLAILMAGGVLVLGGLAGLGNFVKLLPYPVTTGFLTGVAVLLLLSQLPALTGIEPDPSTGSHPVQDALDILPRLASAHGPTIAVGLATIAIIALFQRFLPRVPGHVVALVAVTTAVHALGDLVPVARLSDLFQIPRGMPRLGVPEITLARMGDLLPSALVLAMLGAIESLSTAVVADGMAGTRHDSNQELMGQGIANLVAPLFGGILTVAAISRTATAIQNGARTQVATLVHSAVLLVVLLALAPVAGTIPVAALAGLLAVVAYNSAQRRRFVEFRRMPRRDLAVLLATFALTVFVNLAVAVAVGILLAALLFLHRMSELTQVELVDPAKGVIPLGVDVRQQDIPPGVLIYSIDGPFFFGAAERFQQTIASINRPPKVVIFRMRAVPYLDATGLNALRTSIERLQRRGTRVMLSNIQTQPLEVLQRTQTVGVLGDGNLFRRTRDALAAAREHVGAPPLEPRGGTPPPPAT